MIKHVMMALTFAAIFAWPSPQTAAREAATPQDDPRACLVAVIIVLPPGAPSDSIIATLGFPLGPSA